jgi:RimJ/RimL family protein N-acetyltransferase
MTFEPQPTLDGKLLSLRPLAQSDFAAIFAAASDPLIWEQHPAHDRHQESVFRKLFAESVASRGALVAIERASGRIIGWSRYHGYDARASEVEIGWTFLERRFWGGRYNGEMKRLMLAHALRFVNRVIFVIGENNIRSQRAVERIGAVHAGPYMVDGRSNRVVYEIRRDRSGPGGAQPPGEIRTERLLVRRWRPDDAALLKDAIDSNLDWLQRWLPWAMSEPSPLEVIRERLGTFAAKFDAGAEWLYGIFSPDEGRVLGGIGLHPRIALTGLEIGYWIRESETGHGYATEAAGAITTGALALPQIDHVEIRCDPLNQASAAIPRRLGYAHIETVVEKGKARDGGPRAAMIWRLER